MPDKDYLEQCLQEWEDLLQQELISITGDETAKLSHYDMFEGEIYAWYSTATHTKSDLVEVLNIV